MNKTPQDYVKEFEERFANDFVQGSLEKLAYTVRYTNIKSFLLTSLKEYGEQIENKKAKFSRFDAISVRHPDNMKITEKSFIGVQRFLKSSSTSATYLPRAIVMIEV